MSQGWANPYAANKRMSQVATANRERVMRQKKEKEFLNNVKDKYEMSNMEEVEARIEEQNKIKLLDMKQMQRSRSPSLAANSPQAREFHAAPLPINTVATFDGGMRCFFSMHGGSTIWTGEPDGSIGVRSGIDGKVSYRISRYEDTLVEVLYLSSAQQMWVGLSDGTVRIYDPLVFVLLFEGKRHETPVTCFTETFDGKMFSASEDGAIVKWDSEAHDFDCIIDLPADGSKITAMSCYGYNLFVANESNYVRCIDTDTGAEVRKYEGHEEPVTAVGIGDGFLWTTSKDTTVRVWSIDDGECLATLSQHKAGATSMMIDELGRAVWTADESGLICVWHSGAEKKFGYVRSFQMEGEKPNIQMLKGFVAVDASKMWSLGSNGENCVWHSATNRIERSAKQGILGMDHIIDQDAKELERWRAIIENLKAVAARLRVTMSRELGSTGELVELRAAYVQWFRYNVIRKWKRRRPYLATVLHHANEDDLRARYMHIFYLFRRTVHLRKHKQQVTKTLEMVANNKKIMACFRKGAQFYRMVQQKMRVREAATILQQTHERRLMVNRFNAWQNFHSELVRFRKRTAMALSLFQQAERNLTHHYYAMWASAVQRLKQAKEAVARADAIGGVIARYQRQNCFKTWMRYAKRNCYLAKRARMAIIMDRRHQLALQATAYYRWMRYSNQQVQKAMQRQLLVVREDAARLQRQLDAVAHIVGRQKLDEETQTLIDATKKNIEAKKNHWEFVQAEQEELKEKIEAKGQADAEAVEAMKANMAKQVADLVAVLKAKLINLHSDYTLFRKVNEKTQTIPASKLFLEGHAAVKRVVVGLTGVSNLQTDDEWPLEESKVRKLPKHHSEALLQAIKTMIITYDIMTPAERAELSTDNEIVINAKWIQLFADACVELRKKAMRR